MNALTSLPGYAAIIDKDVSDKLKAEAREANVEDNVKIEENHVVVIAVNEHGHYLVVNDKGRSYWINTERVWFATNGSYPRFSLVKMG